MLNATPHINDLVRQYRDIQKQRQEAELAERHIRNTLAAIVQSADRTIGSFGTIGWVRPGVKAITDWEAVARSMKPSPALIRRHTTTRQDAAYLRAWWKREIDAKTE